MYAPIHVLHGMIDNLVGVLTCQSFVRQQSICVQSGSRFDMLFNFRLQRIFPAIRDYYRANLSTTFKNSHDCGFIFAARSCDAALLYIKVHISRFATDERFIGFNLARSAISRTTQLPERTNLCRQSNTMQHEPCCFLRNAQVAGNLIGANSVLAIN